MDTAKFQLQATYAPAGDQPQAIARLIEGCRKRARGADAARRHRLGQDLHHRQRDPEPCSARRWSSRTTRRWRRSSTASSRDFFPNNAVEYFVSYYDYYQPEAYVPSSDTFIEKDSSVNEHIEQMRLSATKALLERRGHASSWPRCRRSTASAIPQAYLADGAAPQARRQTRPARAAAAPGRHAVHAQRHGFHAGLLPRARRRHRHLPGRVRSRCHPRRAVRRRDRLDCRASIR